MRKLIASGAIAAVTLGLASPALAGTGASVKDNCVTVDETQIVNGVTIKTGSHTVCESHDVSKDGASVSVSYSGTAPSVTPPQAGQGFDVPAVPSLDDLMTHVCGIRSGEWRDGDPTDAADLYRRLVECLGFTIYENTQCDPPARAGESDLECWATDYLVGDYVRNALIDWVDRVVPLPAPVKDTAQELLDTIVDVTNGDTSGLPEPTVPEHSLPGLPDVPAPVLPEGSGHTPQIPDVEEMVRNLKRDVRRQVAPYLRDIRQTAPDESDVPTPDEIADLLGAAAQGAQDSFDQLFDDLYGAGTDAADAVLDEIEAAAATARRTIGDARQQAEQLADQAVRDSGQQGKVDRVKADIARYAQRIDRMVSDNVDFLRRQAGV